MSLAEFFTANFQAHRAERAYGQRRGYRMEWSTYGEILDRAAQFAHELHARQIAKGDRILLWGENSAEWVAAFFGCALIGVIAVPMDNGGAVDFAARVAKQVDAKLLVCSRNHAAHAGEIAASPLILEDLSETLALHPAIAPTIPINRDDILQIVFTSGTTAEPKGVVITHGNVLANVAPLEKEIRRYLKYERFVHPIRFLNVLPLSHVFGQFLGMFLPPLLGGTVIFQDELNPSEVMQTIRRERVSVLVSVPRILQSLKQKIERDLTDNKAVDDFHRRFRGAEGRHFLRRWWMFRSIRRQFGWKFLAFICGGAALDAETEQFWDRLGYAAIQGYGLTETTSLISVNHPFRLGKGSIGKVLPGREVKLADDGEILVRGGGVTSGYWGQSAPVSDGDSWYRTGDIGALDSAGNLYFKGRKKEVIVTPAGTNVYPEDLEARLRRQPQVKDCVVVGIDRGGNAEACAVLILRGDADAKSVVQRANESLAEFQRIRMWTVWPQADFPRTSTQKPRTNLIREFAQAQMAAGQARNNNEAVSPLAELIERVAGRHVAELKADANLDSDLGLSSLDRVELMGALEDRYQITLSESSFSSARTVGDLERMLRGVAPQRVVYHYPRWTLSAPMRVIRVLAYYLLARPAMILLGWPRIEGRENLRGLNGPILVASNHVAEVDFAFILAALPARFRHRIAIATRGEALEALHSPAPERGFFLGAYDRLLWLLGTSLLNLFPLPREAGFRQSFAYAGEAVDRGYSVLVFPEGRHTPDGKVNSFRAGIGLLANNLGIPVVPMRIFGLFELKQAGRRFAAPWKIRVCIGRPMNFAPGTSAEQIAWEVQRAVEALT